MDHAHSNKRDVRPNNTIDISQILNQRNQNVNQVNDPWINSWITNQKPAFPKWTHVIGMIGFVGHLVSGKLSRELIVRLREGSGCFRINKCRICWQFTWYLCFQVYSYNYCHSKYIAVKFSAIFACLVDLASWNIRPNIPLIWMGMVHISGSWWMTYSSRCTWIKFWFLWFKI